MQRKCFEEIQRVIGGNKEKPVTLKDLQNLSYLDLVIKETLRLYPSVPLIGREITEETSISKQAIATPSISPFARINCIR